MNRLPTQDQKDAKAIEMIPELSLLPNTTHPDVVRISKILLETLVHYFNIVISA